MSEISEDTADNTVETAADTTAAPPRRKLLGWGSAGLALGAAAAGGAMAAARLAPGRVAPAPAVTPHTPEPESTATPTA
ncbi:hypothetical protein ACFYO2_46235 [Streptomyces sp. NPDC006602]|uniref:hypothetical protein n=1 Tax=Streptomyces sp. NPDC006602 TaxID=3364751 RepID=UPI0036CBD890